MKLGPTVDGRVKIEITDESDFAFFAEILQDAMGDDVTTSIVDQIARKGTDEDWEEFVKPDLVAQFHKEKLDVGEALSKAQQSEATEIFIDDQNAKAWYSTLNQSRLHLESLHALSKITEDDYEKLEPEKLQVKMKYELYSAIQSLILDTIDFY